MGRAGRLHHPVGRRLLGLARADEAHHRATTRTSSTCSRSPSRFPGEHAAANLGVPDLLFFALFLGASARFGLRVRTTFVALLVGLGVTIAATVYFDLSGLPALPGIALGFLLPNADLIVGRLRGQPGTGDGPHVAVGRPADDR